MEYSEVKEALEAFVLERDWSQFHSEENLAKSISIEAAELLENYQWSPGGNREDIADELADVLTYCFLLAKKLGVDPQEIVLEKLRKTASKYPIDKAKGRSAKYDRL